MHSPENTHYVRTSWLRVCATFPRRYCILPPTLDERIGEVNGEDPSGKVIPVRRFELFACPFQPERWCLRPLFDGEGPEHHQGTMDITTA